MAAQAVEHRFGGVDGLQNVAVVSLKIERHGAVRRPGLQVFAPTLIER